MSYKSSIIKTAIKITPSFIIIWVANLILKGIAELTFFSFDIDTRKVHVQTKLHGETDTIDVWLDDFSISQDAAGAYQFILQHAHSDRPWLTNILAHIAGKTWTIPEIPQAAPYMPLIAEVLAKPELTEVATDQATDTAE